MVLNLLVFASACVFVHGLASHLHDRAEARRQLRLVGQRVVAEALR